MQKPQWNVIKSYHTLLSRTNWLMCFLSSYLYWACLPVSGRKWDAMVSFCIWCSSGVYFNFFYLVIFGGGDEEEDRGDWVETLKPASPLGSLPSHVHHLEGNILDLKVILMDALSGFTSQQDVLLSGKIILAGEAERQTFNHWDKNTICPHFHQTVWFVCRLKKKHQTHNKVQTSSQFIRKY